MTKPELVEKMMTLFSGLERAYGTYDLSRGKVDETGKLVGKPTTKYQTVTRQLWEDHLAGRLGLGIVPIRDDSTCFFGAIDVDIYDLDLKPIFKSVQDNELPLIPCRTKSGGLHLYSFVSEAIPAATMRKKLARFAALLGFGASEIFPKQDEVLSERGDVGAWINVPYFDVDKTSRFALDLNGEGLSIEKFLELAFAQRRKRAEFEAFSVTLLPDLSDGPPCLQHLITHGFMAGTRNDGFFNLGIYLKRKDKETWAQLLQDFNIKYFDPPLLSVESEGIIKSLKKKEYDYGCSKAPLKPHCNSGVCRLRPFGVGALLDMPILKSLTKYDSKPPIWFVDVEGGGRLELDTMSLQNQTMFQRACMNALNVMTPIVKPGAWQGIIKALLESVTIIEVPEDATATGQLKEHLETYCTSMARARRVEELLLGKPWTDAGRTYFRLSDFCAYLERKKFKDFGMNKVTQVLKEMGCETDFMRLHGKGLNIWSVPKFDEVTTTIEPEIETPEQPF
jgi:hypothetical protein